jgi:hypothetical protein
MLNVARPAAFSKCLNLDQLGILFALKWNYVQGKRVYFSHKISKNNLQGFGFNFIDP